MLRSQISNDRSALTNELKLGEDNSDLIKVHPEPNCVSSPRPRPRARVWSGLLHYEN